MSLRQFLNRPTGALSYLLACPQTGQAVMIDPVLDDLTLYLGVLNEMNWQLQMVLETHLHAEHITAAAALRKACGALVASGDPTLASADLRLLHGQHLAVGTLDIVTLATPGHTAHCLTYQCADRLFTGDCLLIGDCGDLAQPGADAGRLYDSIMRRLFVFPDETLLYPGHDRQGRQVSCIGEERRNNQALLGLSRDEFVATQSLRALSSAVGNMHFVATNRLCGVAHP
jgi:glyoxylase-like metal-dependent hydrolase (beta-lactamase superfamily II)